MCGQCGRRAVKRVVCILALWKLCGFCGIAGFQWPVNTLLEMGVLKAEDGAVVGGVRLFLFSLVSGPLRILSEHFWLYVPINVMPHYPPPGHFRGQGGDLTNSSTSPRWLSNPSILGK